MTVGGAGVKSRDHQSTQHRPAHGKSLGSVFGIALYCVAYFNFSPSLFVSRNVTITYLSQHVCLFVCRLSSLEVNVIQLLCGPL